MGTLTKGLRSKRLVSLIETMATPHRIDRYLELVNPMLTVRDLRAKVTEVRHTTAASVSITLEPTWQWDGFKAGQFVTIGVVINGVRQSRCFSPVDSQYRGDGKFELTIKAHDGGLVSNYLRDHAAPGLIVSLSQAGGSFTLPGARPNQILLISGGSGITPVLSMLRTLIDERHDGEIVFLHYTDDASTVAHLEELRELALGAPNVRLVFAHTSTGDGDLQGFFGLSHLEQVAPWFKAGQAFLCGPPALSRSVTALFEAEGIADRLHSEAFALEVATIEAGGKTTFASSNVETDNAGTSLLEQAEKAGLSPEFGCRMGICFSCTAIKKSGCTKSLITGETNSEPDQPIQLCVSAAMGECEIDI